MIGGLSNHSLTIALNTGVIEMAPVRLPLFRMQPRPPRYHAFVSRDGWICLAAILGTIAAMIFELAQ